MGFGARGGFAGGAVAVQLCKALKTLKAGLDIAKSPALSTPAPTLKAGIDMAKSPALNTPTFTLTV